MNTKTETTQLRPCDIAFLKLVKDLPENFLPGIEHYLAWLLHEQSKGNQSVKMPASEMREAMNALPKTAPFFEWMLRGQN